MRVAERLFRRPIWGMSKVIDVMLRYSERFTFWAAELATYFELFVIYNSVGGSTFANWRKQ